MEEKEEQIFDYCKQVDLHALGIKDPLETITSVSGEHNFRAIVTYPNRLIELVRKINAPILGNSSVLPSVIVDYPYGNSSNDSRIYQIQSAKENGAKEIEIMAPIASIQRGDFKDVYSDLNGITSICNASNINFRYVIDMESEVVNNQAITKLSKILQSFKVQNIALSSGYFNSKIPISDKILSLRNFKNKTKSNIKVFINNPTLEVVASYVKAGVDTIGLHWKDAANVIHSFENLIQNSKN